MTTKEGYQVVHMWDLPMPQADMEHLGFPVLNSAIHHTVYAPRTREQGGYNHHPRVFHHAGHFHAIWSNHAHGEDGPGQRVLYSRSTEVNGLGRKVSEVFPAPGPVKPSEENGLVCTAFRILEKDNHLFAIAGLNANVGFQSPDAASFGPERSNQHPMRIPDVLGRGGGGQYPHGIVVDDMLHVIYSMGKEDIAVSSIGLSELGFQ